MPYADINQGLMFLLSSDAVMFCSQGPHTCMTFGEMQQNQFSVKSCALSSHLTQDNRFYDDLVIQRNVGGWRGK